MIFKSNVYARDVLDFSYVVRHDNKNSMRKSKNKTGLALYDEACKLDSGIVTPETEKTILAPLGKAIACLVLACKYIAQIIRSLMYVVLIAIVPNMIIPPSNGHSPEGLLFMGTLAIFLFSTVKLQLKFYDMLFFMISLALLLTFQIWSTALLEWLYKEKGLL